MKTETKFGVFFSYFGGKFMRAPHYPMPRYETIVEPFAGAAGYSTRYHERKIILVDKSPFVCGVWRYLIQATSTEIMRLPVPPPGTDVQSLKIPQEAQWLIGFWINQGSSVPKRTVGGRASTAHGAKNHRQSFATWSEAARARVARQADQIKHWQIIEGDYTDAPDIKATWFIDPTYEKHGKNYPYHVKNFADLASWCRSRQGQTMVCENAGAEWLPFSPITTVKGASNRIVQEMLWTNDEQFPPSDWHVHPDDPRYFHNFKEVLTEAQLRARMSA